MSFGEKRDRRVIINRKYFILEGVCMFERETGSVRNTHAHTHTHIADNNKCESTAQDWYNRRWAKSHASVFTLLDECVQSRSCSVSRLQIKCRTVDFNSHIQSWSLGQINDPFFGLFVLFSENWSESEFIWHQRLLSTHHTVLFLLSHAQNTLKH